MVNMTQDKVINVEARLLAALAHGSVVLQGLGLLTGVLVYINQREKSAYAAFQGLQAAVYQLLGMIVVVGLWVAWGVLYAISMIPLIQMSEQSPDGPVPPLFWIGLGSMIVPMIVMVIIGVIGLIGALRTWQGHEFRYPIIGRWLELSGLWNAKEI